MPELQLSSEARLSYYYANYDTISCIQDTTSPVNTAQDKRSAVFLFTGCIVISLFGGFTLHLALNNKKYKRQVQVYQTHPPPPGYRGNEVVKMEDPVRFATRALGWGTLMSLVGTGTVALVAVYTWKM